MSRRGALGVVAAGVGGVAALAACGSGAGSGDGTTANGSGGGGGQGTGAPAPGTTVTALSAVPVGASVVANAGDAPVAVAQPTAGKAVAHSAICTHMGCTVKAAGKQLHCPCHGSRYDAFTGAVVQGPAPKPLPVVDVHVAAGQVVTGKA
jgi:Rieske Fe-S protein